MTRGRREINLAARTQASPVGPAGACPAYELALFKGTDPDRERLAKMRTSIDVYERQQTA